MKKKSFEEMFEDLKKIASRLEGEELTLEAAIDEFEKGMKIAKQCSKVLDNTSLRIDKIIRSEEVQEEIESDEIKDSVVEPVNFDQEVKGQISLFELKPMNFNEDERKK